VTKIEREEAIVWPDKCPDCGRSYGKDTYDDDRAFYELFIPAGLYNAVGSPGTGKSFTINALIWHAIHNRLCEYWGVVNFRYSRYKSITEKVRVIEGHEVVTRMAETAQIPVSSIHPRVVEISSLVDMVRAIARINKDARQRKVAVRILVALDEAPLSSATGAKGATVAMTATSMGMNQLVTISRKLNFGLILISLDESLLQRKMRSAIQGEEGTIRGLVRCVISKDPETIKKVAKGQLPAYDKATEVMQYRLDGVDFKKLVAFLPQVPGWAPSLRVIGKTPLSCSLDEAQPGDTTFETLTIGGLEVGKLGGMSFDAQHFINRLTNVPPEDVPDACLTYLEEDAEAAQSEIQDLLKSAQDDDTPDVAPELNRNASEHQLPVESPSGEGSEDGDMHPKTVRDPRERKTLERAIPIFERYSNDTQTSFTEVCRLAGVSRKTARKFQKLGLLPKIPTQPEGDE